MKIYKTQKEVEKDIRNNVLAIEGDVKFECSINIEASIKVSAGNILARDISARDISAGNILAGDILARDISAKNILYYAFCCAYNSIKCLSIKARRDTHQEPICLGGKLEIIKEAQTEGGKKIKIRLSNNQIVEGFIVED